MKLKMKRLLGLFLSLALVLGLFPGMSLTAYAADTTITWDTAKLNSMQISIQSTEPASQSKTSDGITVTVAKTVSSAIYYTMEFGSDIMANTQGYFTFESSVGNISKIEINQTAGGSWRSGGAGWPDDFMDFSSTPFTWSGTPAASVTLTGDQGDILTTISSIVFTIEDPAVNLTANEGETAEYWATYYNGTQSYTADANTTVYKAAMNGSSSLTLTEVANREIPADKAVILKSSSATITLTPAATTTADLSDNVLMGGTSVTAGYDAYTLSKGSTGLGTVGFYKFNGASLDGSKAHLEIAQSSPAPARGFFGFGDDNTTAIEAPTATIIVEDGEIYDLTGRRIEGQPTRKGIYVKNGQKFIVK